MVKEKASPDKSGADKKSNSKTVIAEKLGTVLASSYALRLKTQNFHWNVVGPEFRSLHLLFEGQYTELGDAVDEIAERIRALETVSPGSFRRFAELSKIADAPDNPPKATEMIAALVKDNETLSKLCREVGAFADESGDTGTGDIMNGRQLAHDKAAWMLRAHLQ